MIEEKKFLTPIKTKLPPPKHTEIRPQCFICKHFPVCNIREDYLKTAKLIQEILGDPCEKYEMSPPPVKIPDFEGTFIENYEEYFPNSVKSTKNTDGNFYMAKYINSNYIKFIYIFDGYYVLFSAQYNEETKEFDISQGKEICYGVSCEIAEDLELLQLGLLSLKEDIENIESEEKDIINTTYFSAELKCRFYEWEKGLDYYEGIKRIIAQYPNGIPINCNGELYHLATYHIENRCVPCYHPENGQPAFAPMPYPVFIPPKCHKRKPKTRDELNEF